MRTHTLIFKEIPVKIGIYMPIHIPELPDIEIPDITPITNFSKMYIFNYLAPPAYQQLHHTAIIKK